MIIDNVIANIDVGIKGGNKGLYMGYPKLMSFIPGIQPESIYVIGGMTGSGKTAFTLSSFCFNPYDNYLSRKAAGEKISLNILVWSFEMSKEILITKAVCKKIFKDYGILTDINTVLSRGSSRISQEIYDKVISVRKYFEEMEDVVTIMGPENPTGIYKFLKNLILRNGKEETIPTKIMDEGMERTINKFGSYTPYVENSYIVPIIDHLGIMKTQLNYSVKQNIDKLTEYLIELTNKYKISPVLVMQLNRSIDSFDRLKAGAIEVQLSDFMDSSLPCHSAHYVIGLNHPFRWELDRYRDYDISRLKDRFRSVKLVKSRDGVADIVVGMGFIGENGSWLELPPGKEMTEETYTMIEKIKKN